MVASQASTCEAAALLAAIADPIRLAIITKLASSGTTCVCNLQIEPVIPDNQLSYHLKVLRDAGLVTSERRSRWVDYTLMQDALDRLHAAIPSREVLPAVEENVS
ncbi:helix-turn-helix transcriptional regulator [Arcanobacterium phocisimile]|uniref:Helix-turn-helix transcriptional regulator n=1 Tax=Arcanobacterium phocisimile TaxID=1302235 RepID=A0ABX7IEV9_9ACTO|nr:metalloregulator ArsR/SmtB family transcription factor [Arcanobacterium phocisimile]QRV01671.1 helix-turn-helix transcriptional regulator [Arcanobacterium phocisimile]